MGIRFLVHAFGMEYVRMECCGIRSIADRVTNEKYFGSFANRILIVPLFWYWNEDTVDNVVNDHQFRQSDHFKTIYRYAENQLKVWLQDIDNMITLRVPSFDLAQYTVPVCKIECNAVIGRLIYDCEYKMHRSYTQYSKLASINDKSKKGQVDSELVTAENEFWVENYGMTPESLISNTSTNSTFRAITSIYVEIKDMQYGYSTEAPLDLQTIPRAVNSFVARNFWKTVATNDMNNDDQQSTLLLSDLPQLLRNFHLDGAAEFNGTISFDDLPISTDTVSFINSQTSRVSVTKKFDLRSKLKSVSVLSPNLKGNLDLQFFECYRRSIRTRFKFDKYVSGFSVKNDRDYYCIKE